MNFAPQDRTVEISDAEFDNVSGGLSLNVSVTVVPTSVSDSAVLGQADAVENEALSAIDQCHQVGVFAAFRSAAHYLLLNCRKLSTLLIVSARPRRQGGQGALTHLQRRNLMNGPTAEQVGIKDRFLRCLCGAGTAAVS